MKEEIAGGLRNAVERGSSLEAAKRSMINAGYSQSEVEEAAQGLIVGATTMMVSKSVPEKKILSQSFEAPRAPQLPQPPYQVQAQYQSPVMPSMQAEEEKPQKQAKKWLIITLGIVLGLLLLTLIGMFFFADKLLEALAGKLIAG